MTAPLSTLLAYRRRPEGLEEFQDDQQEERRPDCQDQIIAMEHSEPKKLAQQRNGHAQGQHHANAQQDQ